MAIVFHCKCGRPLRAGPELAGKKTKCPGCGAILTVPSAVAPAGVPTGAGVQAPAMAGATAEASANPIASAHGAVAVAEEDPFAPALDWSSLEATRPTAASPTEPEPSGHAIKIDAAQGEPLHVHELDPPRPEDGSRQYRVLTQKDQGFAKFNPAKLEETLNAHARRGWTLKAAVSMDVPGHGGHHDELIVILER